MPIGIRSVELTYAPAPTGNGIRIIMDRGTFEITESTIPPNVINKPIATVEDWCNTWLSTNVVPPPYLAVHIFSLSPFAITIYTGDAPPPPNWWA